MSIGKVAKKRKMFASTKLFRPYVSQKIQNRGYFMKRRHAKFLKLTGGLSLLGVAIIGCSQPAPAYQHRMATTVEVPLSN